MVDREQRIPSNAVVQEGSSSKVSGDGGITTVPREIDPVLDDSGDKGLKGKSARPKDEPNVRKPEAEKGEDRGHGAVPPRTLAKESSTASPRLPVGKMKWSQLEEQEPVNGGHPQPEGEYRADALDAPEGKEKAEERADRTFSPPKADPPEKERKAPRSDKESLLQGEKKEPSRGRKIPVGVLKWRKDEELDGEKKGNFPGKGFRSLKIFPQKAEKSDKELSVAQRRLRKAVKVLWIPSLLFGSLLIGLLIGYAGLGGQSPLEVFDLDLWKHIYQQVYG